jgi:probable F420-dependent oxidoreductase
MKIGVIVPAGEADGDGATPPWPSVRSFAQRAEARGLDALWMYDHFYNATSDGALEGQHEAWTIVSALAASTERIEIGTIVLCASFRSPTLLAKMAAALDEVSGGRLILGLGAGWHDPEYDAFGFPKDHRVGRFDEYLQVVAPLVRGERVTFEGSYVRARDAVLVPPPSRPIPVLVAAFGERMLRLTARHADLWNTAWFGVPGDELAEAMAAFDRAMEAEGRDRSAVGTTVGITIVDPDAAAPAEDDDDPVFDGSVEELASMFDEYEALGVAHLIAGLRPMTEASIDRVALAIERRRT